MTTDDIRAAIAGIVAEQQAVWEALSKKPRNLHTEEGRRVFDSLFARHATLVSQRETLEQRLNVRAQKRLLERTLEGTERKARER